MTFEGWGNTIQYGGASQEEEIHPTFLANGIATHTEDGSSSFTDRCSWMREVRVLWNLRREEERC